MLCNETVGAREEHSALPAQPPMPWESPMEAWPSGEKGTRSKGGTALTPFRRDREFEVEEAGFIKGCAGETGQPVP